MQKLGIVQELNAAEIEATFENAGNPARMGRPATLMRLNPTISRFIAIQIEVAETSITAVPLAVRQEDVWSAVFPTGSTPREWQQRLRQTRRGIAVKGLWGIVASIPGIVNEKTGRVVFSPNLHWTEQADIPSLIREIWPLPIILNQEIRALALGHLIMHPHDTDFLLVDFDQGVGGAIVEGGRLYRNPLPLNGELGHTPVRDNQRRCGCGAIGCVETLLSRRGLVKSYAESGAPAPHAWQALMSHLEKNGVPEWLGKSLDAMGIIIAGSLNVLGLRQVVVTGSLTEFPPAVLQRLSLAIQQGAMWARFGEVTCKAAPRRRMAGLVAAGMDRLLFPVEDPDSLDTLPPSEPQLRTASKQP